MVDIPDIDTQLGLTRQPPQDQATAAVLAVLHRVESDYTVSDAATALDMLGLLDTARDMWVARTGRPAPKPAAGVPPGGWALCPQGLHPMSPNNVRKREDGYRECRLCLRRVERERRRKAREAAS